jgi:hypothetical protein
VGAFICGSFGMLPRSLRYVLAEDASTPVGMTKTAPTQLRRVGQPEKNGKRDFSLALLRVLSGQAG